MQQREFASLEWNSAPMPGSSGPVQLALLPRLGDGGFRAFVRFPAGWARLAAGHYPVAEEFLVLEGDLTLDGRTWHAGGYAWIAAGRVRSISRSDSGCLAFAWFGGAPRWQAGAPATPAAEADLAFAHWRDAPRHVLRAGPGHATCVIGKAGPRALDGLAAPFELLALDGYTWCADTAECPAGFDAGPVLVRNAYPH